MAQKLAELQPFESLQHYLGAELRAWRLLRRYSLARLGSAVHVSGDLLGKIEKAQRWPSADLVERCDKTLNAAGTLTRLYELARRGFHEPADHGTRPCGGDAVGLAADTATPEDSQPAPYAGSELAVVVNFAGYRRRRQALPAGARPANTMPRNGSR